MIDGGAIVRALGGRWAGQRGMCRCPAHPDRTPSLSLAVREGRLWVHCFAGCPREMIFQALKERGLYRENSEEDWRPTPEALARWKAQREKDRRERLEENTARVEDAHNLWLMGGPIEGTAAEAYLRGRGIRIRRQQPSLRYVASVWHVMSRTIWPALLCAVRDRNGAVTAVQRIYIKPDGSGKAEVDKAKLTLGILGSGAVQFGNVGEVMGVAEGPETALSAMQMFSLPVWATLGAGRLAAIDIPDGVQEIIIFGDHGAAGERAAEAAADHYFRRGYMATVQLPPDGVKDFNDALRAAA